MKHTILTLAFLLVLIPSVRSQALTLQTCIDSAMVNYPLSRQQDVYAMKTETELLTIRNSNLPQIDLTGRATYQNEVIELPLTIPGMDIPEISKDQYKIQLEINQALYKGGLTKAQKSLANIDNQINNKQTEVELNKVKAEVVRIYYGILLDDELEKVSRTYHNTLQSKLGEMETMIENGVILPSSADVIRAEMLSIEQKITGFQIRKQYLLKRLSLYTGIKTGGNTTFELPQQTIDPSASQQRPEYELMSLNIQKLEAMKSLTKAQSRPKAFAFSTLGYGRPGFNYLSNDFTTYAIVGAGLSWSLWNWNKYSNQRKILDFSGQAIKISQQSFETSLNEKLLELKAEIETQKSMLKKAEEIAELRKRVSETSARQMKNGTITSSRYIDELQKYKKALLDIEIYKIRLSIAETNYLWALGKL